MKTVSPTLLAFLSAARTRDFPVAMADCFTFNLVNGGSSYFTNYDVGIVWNGQTFLAESVLIQGLKFKVSTGLEVDRQQITLLAPAGSTIAGSPWLSMMRSGAFDGAGFQRDRVFLDPSLPGGIDGLTLFKGRVSTIDKVGRTSVQLTIASPLVVLDYYMPRNVFSPNCLHTLYDAGCQANKALFQQVGTVGAGSTQTIIYDPSHLARAEQAQGAMYFNAGLDAGLRATIKAVAPGQYWQLMYPLPAVPAAGDQILVYFGCDHTLATCGAVFNNKVHFRGFPNVPPPDYAI